MMERLRHKTELINSTKKLEPVKCYQLTQFEIG
jgi:hypothetical protein